MAIADVASRLYSSSAYRNTPVLKALSDAFIMNLKFRFSMIGMAASLTGSKTLYSIAQQKYLVTEEEKQQEKRDRQFKQNVVVSLSTLSKQVSILESVVERNTLMISAISNEIGFFKGQRKPNINNYTQLKSFRIPVNSKSVKGQIDIINSELQKLKSLRKTGGESSEEKKKRIIEDERVRALIAATVGATLTGLGLKAVGASNLTSILGATGVGAISAFLASETAQAVTKKIVGTALPIVGSVFKLQLLRQLGAEDRAIKRLKGEKVIDFTKFNSDVYKNNFDPNKNPLEWRNRQNEIEILKTFEQSIETLSKPIDNMILLLEAYFGFKIANSVFKGGKAIFDIIKKIKNPGAAAVTGIFESMGGGMAASASKVGLGAGAAGLSMAQLTAVNQYRNMINPKTGKPFTLSEAFKLAKQQSTTGTGAGPRVPGTPLSKAPKTTGIARRVRKVFANKKMLLALKKINSYLKIPAIKTGLVGAGLAALDVLNMIEATNQYENGNIDYSEYKDRMVSGFKGIVSVIGAAGIGSALGAVVGGPLGIVVGALGGVGASLLFDDTNTLIAEKLFAIIGENEPPYSNIQSTVVSGDVMGENVAQSPVYNGALTDPQGSVPKILATIRMNESGNNYSIETKVPGQTASGAYQFTDGTWKGLTKKYGIGTEYSRAKNAPPEIQDAIAAMYVNEILIKANGDISKVPLVWYTGNYEGKMSAQQLAANKGQTAQQYQAKWLSVYGSADPNVNMQPILAGAGLTGMSALQTAGAGLTGMSALQTSLFDFFGKDFSKVNAAPAAEQMENRDEAARAATQQLTAAVASIVAKQTSDKMETAKSIQKTIDEKFVKPVNYVDHAEFEDEFRNLSMIL